MAEIKNFGLVGVGTKLQMGKGGSKLMQTGDAIAFRKTDETTLTNVFIAEPTATSHATTKQYVDSLVTNLDAASISDNKANPTAKVSTNLVTGQVTVEAKGPNNVAARVATFKSGATADSSLAVDTSTSGEVLMTVVSSLVDANLHLAPQGNGHVIIGESGANTLMQADNDASMTLAGGDSTTVGGDLILKGGNGSTSTGNVYVESGAGVPIVKFASGVSANTHTTLQNGTDVVSITAAGVNADVDLVLLTQGAGKVKFGNKVLADVAAPVLGTDAVNKAYLDTVVVTSKVGSIQTREITVSTATMDIGLPLLGRVRRVMLHITTAYSAGAQLTVGTVSASDMVIDANMIDETMVGVYDLNVDVNFTTSTQLRGFITGGPATGAAKLVVEYVQG